MGKNKAKRFGALRPNPTGALSEKDLELDIELNNPQNQNVPSSLTAIIEKLQAPGQEERACGCQLLAGLVSQPKAIDFLLQQNVVRIIAPLFVDACHEVQKSALGAARNMTVYGNETICDVMVANDVLTPLAALIKQFGNGWVPEKVAASKCDTASNVLREAVDLLSNLCENNMNAVRIFNKENLLTVLLPLLKVEVYGYPLSNSVARCVHVVSENNPDVATVCLQPQVQAELFRIITSATSGLEASLFRTLITGIVLNLKEMDVSPHYQGIVRALSEVLEIDCLPLITKALDGTKETPEKEMFEAETSWPDIDQLIQAQAVCLELVANMCCFDDEWEDMDCQGSEESSDDQAVDASDGDCMNCDANDSLCLPSEIHTAFMDIDILSQILFKAAPLEELQVSQLKMSRVGRNTIEKFQDLQARALLCLSNVVSTLDGASIEKSTPLMSIWSDVYNLAKASVGTLNENHRWAVTSAMRAVIQRIAELKLSDLREVSEPDLDFLVSLGIDSKNRETQINVVRIISTVGCILAVNLEPHPLLKKIGEILLHVACGNEDIVVTSEALDSLFDVFKDDHTDPVVKEITLIDRLRTLQTSFKTRVSSQRKKLGENYAVVMMAKSNLAGYIQYKMSTK